jgi:hypothetical protein
MTSPATCPRLPRSRGLVWITSMAALSIAIVGGCSSSGSTPQLGNPTPESSTIPAPPESASTSSPAAAPPSSTSRSSSTRHQIRTQYNGFWSSLPVASRAAPGRRRAILARYSADPELTSLLTGMATQDRKGEVIYGRNVTHPRLHATSTTVGRATITDCQNASDTGVARLRPYVKLTVGVAHTSVVTTMHRGSDGHWRVTFVSYPKRSC